LEAESIIFAWIDRRLTIKTKVIPASHPHAYQEAIEVLLNRGLVVFPTDTVYGIGALVFDNLAVEKLFLAKERDAGKAIPVLLNDFSQLTLVAQGLNKIAERLAKRYWPGALTLLVRKNISLPANITPYSTIGVRMPDHPVTLRLLHLAGPLAVTSANISGEDDATTAEEVLQHLKGRVNLIIDGGKTPGGDPSTVVDCTVDPPKIIRQGPISEEQILSSLD
jgi:L-threonylcarbamoyladenylate synthase